MALSGFWSLRGRSEHESVKKRKICDKNIFSDIVVIVLSLMTMVWICCVYIMYKSRGAKKIILKNKWTKKSCTFIINDFGDKLKQKRPLAGICRMVTCVSKATSQKSMSPNCQNSSGVLDLCIISGRLLRNYLIDLAS